MSFCGCHVEWLGVTDKHGFDTKYDSSRVPYRIVHCALHQAAKQLRDYAEHITGCPRRDGVDVTDGCRCGLSDLLLKTA